jgi:hypothetical protein
LSKSADEIDRLVAAEVNKQVIEPNKTEAERFDRLAKTVSDKELSQYYRHRADSMNVIVQALKSAAPAPKPVTPKAAARTAAASFNQAVKPSGNKVIEQTAKAGLLANMESALNEAREHERRYQEKMDAVKRAPRELVSYYTDQARTYRASAEMARSRAESFRRAAAAL